MINSIFLSFDINSCELSLIILTYLYIFIPSIIFMQITWSQIPTRFILHLNLLSSTFILNISTNSNNISSTYIIISSTFYAILTINLGGITPIIFSPTSHLILTLSIALPIWLSIVIITLITNSIILNSHFVPENTPNLLINFLSAVESLSSLIRPITLSFRLSANISAGHIILAIISSSISSLVVVSLIILLLPLWFTAAASYGSFEVIICLIQAFVFMLLSIIYSNDYTLNH